VAVPEPARTAFLAVSPGVVAAWALGGLYLSLGSSLALALLHSSDRVASSLPIVALAGVSTVTAVLTRGWAAGRAMLIGTVLLAAGVGGTLAGVAGDQAWLLIAGSAVAGLGWGPAFAGALRTVTPLARPAERAGLLAAMYVLAYLLFSLPAVAAGFAVTRIGLRDTADLYGAVVIVLAALATAAFGRQARRRPADQPG
jgi:MFS family permease